MAVTVKAIKKYHDLQQKKVIEPGKQGDTFEASKERADYLVKQGMVKIIETAGKTEKKTGEGKEQ